MASNEIIVKDMVISNITNISIKSDVFDIIARQGKIFRIYFDSKHFKKEELPGSLIMNEIEKSICYTLLKSDINQELANDNTDLNPAIIVDLPIDREFILSLETDTSDIYLSEVLLKYMKTKIFCNSKKGNVLKKTFMYFEKVEV